MYGPGKDPDEEDMLIIPLFEGRDSILGMIEAVRQAVATQFTLISCLIWATPMFCSSSMFETPTLLTRRLTSIVFSSSVILSKNCSSCE